MTASLACTTCSPAHVLSLLPVTSSGHLILARLPLQFACGASPAQERPSATGEGTPAVTSAGSSPAEGWAFTGRAAIACPDCLIADLGFAEILDFEAASEKLSPRAKATAIRERFAFSPTRYLQVLVRALENPEALAHAPDLVPRLLRLRDVRREIRRAGRRLDPPPTPVRVDPRQRSLDLAS